MCGESKEHVLQVCEGWHVDEFAALNQGIEQGGAPGALHAAREEPVLPAHRDDAQLVLRARMPPAGLCRVMRMGGWIERISTPTFVADAA